jgi:hypothetical protein
MLVITYKATRVVTKITIKIALLDYRTHRFRVVKTSSGVHETSLQNSMQSNPKLRLGCDLNSASYEESCE